jgi:hypothetical protein
MALFEATQASVERHDEILQRLNRIEFIEERLEELRNLPPPNQFFENDWPEILKNVTGRDPRTVDFKDRHGECMLVKHPRFNLQNTNLFGLQVIDRMYSKEQQALMCGPYAIRGSNLPPMPQDDVYKVQGKIQQEIRIYPPTVHVPYHSYPEMKKKGINSFFFSL